MKGGFCMTGKVECPYYYATYDVEKLEDMQIWCTCQSILQVEFDEDGEPYIEDS